MCCKNNYGRVDEKIINDIFNVIITMGGGFFIKVCPAARKCTLQLGEFDDLFI